MRKKQTVVTQRQDHAALMRALRQLPGADAKLDKLENSAFRLESASTIMRLADLPRAQNAGPDATRKELEKFSRLASTLWKHIDSMHQEALSVLADTDARDWLLVKGDLAALVGVAKLGIENHLNQGPGPKGRPRKQQAHDVALIAAGAYRAITGEEPSVGTKDGRAYGPFLKFVDSVFSALGIQASAETYSREVTKVKKPPSRVQ